MKRLISIAALALLATSVIADHHETPEMSAEEKAMMEAMIANGTPGKPHKHLADSAGSYTAKMYSWGKPGDEPTVSDMTVKRKMQLGGRVLEETWHGDFMGTAFVGYSRTGYDNQNQRYWTTWTDNISTGLFIAYGNWDEQSGELVYHGDATDPVTGKPIPTRSVVTYMDEGESMAMYQTVDGQEFKAMAFEMVRK